MKHGNGVVTIDWNEHEVVAMKWPDFVQTFTGHITFFDADKDKEKHLKEVYILCHEKLEKKPEFSPNKPKKEGE